MHRLGCKRGLVMVCCWLSLASMSTAAAQEISPPGRPVSLEEAIQIALQNQGRMATSEEAVTISRQRLRQAQAGLLPDVTGTVTFTTRGSSDLAGIFGVSRGLKGRNTVASDSGPQPAISLQQTVFDAGQTRLRVRQARVNVGGAQATLQQTRNDLALLIARDYLNQLRSAAILALRTEQVRQAVLQLQEVLAQIQVGARAAVDRYLQESTLLNLQVERTTAENDLRVAATTLRNDMGLPAGPAIQLIDPVQSPETLQPPPLTEMQQQAMQARPEVVAAEAALRAQNMSVALARLQRRPVPQGRVSVDILPRSEVERSDFLVSTSLAMPLFDAGVTRASERIERASARRLAAQLEQEKRDVAAEVQEAYYNYVSSLHNVESSRGAVVAADANLRATSERLRLGAQGVGIVELVVAQTEFFNANNNLVQSKYNVILALAQLNRAVGKQ
jgi:outer membrane protein